jgi:hypothetical protein
MKLESFAFALVVCLGALSAFAAEERCGPHELTAALRFATPSYTDAMILKQDLTEDGFEVQCVLESKWGGMFGDAKLGYRTSGALFITDRGDFDVLFLPATHVFDLLEIKEQKNGRFYDYSFSGYPPSGAHVESGGRTYFIKRGNKLFVANYASLATALAKAPMR